MQTYVVCTSCQQRGNVWYVVRGVIKNDYYYR